MRARQPAILRSSSARNRCRRSLYVPAFCGSTRLSASAMSAVKGTAFNGSSQYRDCCMHVAARAIDAAGRDAELPDVGGRVDVARVPRPGSRRCATLLGREVPSRPPGPCPRARTRRPCSPPGCTTAWRRRSGGPGAAWRWQLPRTWSPPTAFTSSANTGRVVATLTFSCASAEAGPGKACGRRQQQDSQSDLRHAMHVFVSFSFDQNA